MVRALEANGVRAALSFCSPSLSELLDWIGKHLFYPVVVKPPKSAGTDNVTICHSTSEVETAFANIMGKKNRLDLTNESVLVQEFLVGKEYMVDTVSFDGQTVICAYQQANKIAHEGAMIYDVCSAIPFDSKAATMLSPYICEVLTALEIKWGPSHLEIIITPRGPVLVEVGARLDGCRAPEILRKAISVDQCEITVDCYLNPKTSREKWEHYPFKIHKNFSRVFLISDSEGLFLGYGFNERIRQLSSFDKFVSLLSVGSPMVKTSNLFNIPGYVDLIHVDPVIMEKDYRQIRLWEKEPRFFLTQDDTSEVSDQREVR